MTRCAVILKTIRIALAVTLLLIAVASEAAGCRTISFLEKSYSICEADPATDDIQLFLNDADGKRLGGFGRVEALLEQDGRELLFAMNAGMYHPNRLPVGLYIEDGETLTKIVTRKGPGNFGLLPNGVLCLSEGAAAVIESRTFAQVKPECSFATQSGPMLVINGELHPRFIRGSSSRYRRNGVGVTADGRLIVAISNEPVNFDNFGRLFRDVLKTPNALFLDGNISRLYAPELGRNDPGFPMGPILGVTSPAD